MKAAIVGGGIGGLTAAIALRRRGISVRVYEQADAVSAIGASLQLGPNAGVPQKRGGRRGEKPRGCG
jgi:salicylate hydroxylase